MNDTRRRTEIVLPFSSSVSQNQKQLPYTFIKPYMKLNEVGMKSKNWFFSIAISEFWKEKAGFKDHISAVYTFPYFHTFYLSNL